VNEPTTSATPVGSAMAAICAPILAIYSGVNLSDGVFRICAVDLRPAIYFVSFCIATSRPLFINSLFSESFFNLSYCYLSFAALAAFVASFAAELAPKVATLKARLPTLLT
jgi:hypothetical protein